MKWLFSILLWVLALVVALGVLWRIARGRHVVLRGRWTPRFVRMVAIVLVVLGVGVDRTDAAPVGLQKNDKQKPEDSLPPGITAEAALRWVTLQNPLGEWVMLKRSLGNPSRSVSRCKP